MSNTTDKSTFFFLIAITFCGLISVGLSIGHWHNKKYAIAQCPLLNEIWSAKDLPLYNVEVARAIKVCNAIDTQSLALNTAKL